jgi:hypothetical protein
MNPLAVARTQQWVDAPLSSGFMATPYCARTDEMACSSNHSEGLSTHRWWLGFYPRGGIDPQPAVGWR